MAFSSAPMIRVTAVHYKQPNQKGDGRADGAVQQGVVGKVTPRMWSTRQFSASQAPRAAISAGPDVSARAGRRRLRQGVHRKTRAKIPCHGCPGNRSHSPNQHRPEPEAGRSCPHGVEQAAGLPQTSTSSQGDGGDSAPPCNSSVLPPAWVQRARGGPR